MKENHDYYYNVESGEGVWVPPEPCLTKESWLMEQEIEVGGQCESKVAMSWC